MATLRALLIGVSTYENFPHRGIHGVRDATRWRNVLWELFGKASVPITLLTDPPQGEPVDRATRARILEKARELSDAMSDDDHLVVTFSGHGATDARPDKGKGLMGGPRIVLCPWDVDLANDGTLKGVLHLEDLLEALGNRVAQTTLFIDASFAPSADPAHRVLGPTRQKPRCLPLSPVQRSEFENARILLAGQPWEHAAEVPTGSQRVPPRMQGAFSYAVTTLLERWNVVRTDGGPPYINAQYGAVRHRTREFLEVLGIEQNPMLLGPSRLPLVPVFRPTLKLAEGLSSPRPDGYLPRRQFNSDVGTSLQGGCTVFDIRLVPPSEARGKPFTIAQVLVTSDFRGADTRLIVLDDQETNVVPREEYWRVVPIEWFEMELFETVERIARIELRPVLEHRFTSHQSDVPQTIPLTALTRSTGAESNIGWIDNDNTEKHSSVYRRNGMLPGLLPEEYAKTRRMTHGPEGDEDWASACTSTSRASPFSSTSSTRRSRSTAGKSLPSSAAPTARSR